MMRGVVPPHGAAFSRCHCIHQQGPRQQSRNATLGCFIAPGTKQPIGSDARPRHLLYVVFQLTAAYQVSLEAQRISHVRKQSCARSHWVAGPQLPIAGPMWLFKQTHVQESDWPVDLLPVDHHVFHHLDVLWLRCSQAWKCEWLRGWETDWVAGCSRGICWCC